jgi:cellulose biosynthesis protein BcsQ
MALANIAVILAQWGYKTLLIDWDLEAPGLENFFKRYIKIKKISRQKGLIDILTSEPHDPDSWKNLVIPINIPENMEPIHLLTAGDRIADYFKKVRNFDINIFYENKDGGNFIETMRNQWKDAYDFVLIDSRTGITDIGGICTIQLPDVLVLLFTTTEMGFKGILDVAKRSVKAQQSLPFDRFKLISLPIPAKFDTLTEFKISQRWLDKFSTHLKEIYNDWLPKRIGRRHFLELTKIPYVSYFSFGEKLPVIEHGIIDPSGLGYAYETISALLANDFNFIEYLMDNRDEFINMAIKRHSAKDRMKKLPKDAVKVFISYSQKDKMIKNELEEYLSVLERRREATFWSDEKIVAGMPIWGSIVKHIKDSHLFLILISKDFMNAADCLEEMEKIFKEAEKKEALIIPIILTPSPWTEIDFLASRQALPLDGKPLSQQEDQETAFADIVKQIEKSILHIKNKAK